MTHPLELIHPRNLKHLSGSLQALVRSKLWLQVLLGLTLGLLVGLLLGPDAGYVDRDTAALISSWLVLPGNIFLAVIQMIVIPLILASVVRGIAASGSMEQLRTSGVRLVCYFLFTTTVAISIGIGVTTLVAPGTYIDFDTASATVHEDDVALAGVDVAAIPEALVSVLPQNPFSAAVEQQMLQIVVFSIIFGLALVSIPPKKSAPLLELLGSLQSVVMRIVRYVMHLAPYAVFGFMAQITIETGVGVLVGIGAYVSTVLCGLFLLMLLYLAIAWQVGLVSPRRFLRAARELQLLAFSTNSSVAVMPLTLKTAEEKLGVRASTAQFVIPIGATVNMDGTALFQGAATLFLTQMYGIDVGIGMLVALVATAIGASIGTPATPGVGIVILSAVLTGVGVPVEGVALIIGVDRVLELFRTATNVTGDLVAALVIDRFAHYAPSHAAEAAYEEETEAIRKETGEDVLTGDLGDTTIDAKRGIVGKLFGWF